MAKVQTKKINDEIEMSKFIKLIIIVAVIVLAFYILTALINKKNSNDDVQKTPASIQYDEILVGNILNQPSNNYYVLIEDINDDNVSAYLAYMSIYKTKEDSKRVYTAVLNNLFNKKYMADNSNISADMSDFKISQTTLVEVSNGKIIKSYEKTDDILTLLQELTKEEN